MGKKDREIERLTRELKIRDQRILDLEKRILELEKRLLQYDNPHTPPSLKKDKPEDKPRQKGKPGRPPGHVGVTRPQATPTQTASVEADTCPHCQNKLGKATKVETQIIEEIPEPQPLIVTEFKIHHYDCPKCGKHVTATDKRLPKEGIFGPRLLAHINMLRYRYRLTHRKITEFLKHEYNLEIAPATVLDITRRVSDCLQNEYQKVKESVRKSRASYTDETGCPVQGTNYWLWGFTTDNETLIAIRKSRGKKVLTEMLGNKYSGTIISDGHRSYSNYTKNQQRCWSHILRDTQHAAEKHPEAKALDKAMHRLYHKLTRRLEHQPPPEERIILYRQAHATLKRWTARRYETAQVDKLSEKIKTASESLLKFITTPGIEPTNNRAERALREHVVMRKIIGTLRNEKGTQIHETLMTMLATWKQQNKDPYQMIQTQIS